MYKGYQSYRHYLNSKLHGLSVRICGGREVLDQEIYSILQRRSAKAGAQDSLHIGASTDSISTTMLTDTEASDLYNRLIGTCRKVQANL